MKKARKILFLDGNRTGYSVEQCGTTMTVGQLMEFLSDMDEGTQVFLRNDNGYTFGHVRESDFMEYTSPEYENEPIEVEGHPELFAFTPNMVCDLLGTDYQGLVEYYGYRGEDIMLVFHGPNSRYDGIMGVEDKEGNFHIQDGVNKLDVTYETMLEMLER